MASAKLSARCKLKCWFCCACFGAQIRLNCLHNLAIALLIGRNHWVAFGVAQVVSVGKKLVSLVGLNQKDPEAIHLTSAEVGVEESIYPAPLLAINGLGQQTMITTETDGLIYREQGLPLPILYRPNPLPEQPFAAQVLTDHVEISWRRHFQFSPKLDYVAM
ncbi:hypothetical protein [Herpetosiphon sp. NSE202]|uniref:hypothetical protein n=1 Tax=Herpetosiphon sp. NSE202 TaxID=3351349 RepID=UPI00363745D3